MNKIQRKILGNKMGTVNHADDMMMVKSTIPQGWQLQTIELDLILLLASTSVL